MTTDRPPNIRQYCPSCGQDDALFRPAMTGHYGGRYRRICHQCFLEQKRIAYWEKRELKFNKPPNETMIRKATRTSPCTDCMMLDACRELVMRDYVDPPCWVASDKHEMFEATTKMSCGIATKVWVVVEHGR